jgi:uncharacterized protein (TIGR03083 family)
MTTAQQPWIRLAFAEAAAWNLAVVEDIPGDRWEGPGLGVWTLRELVAHTSRAYTTVTTYLRPEGVVDIPDAAAYFVKAVGAGDKAAIHAGVAERARNEVVAFADDPHAELTRRARATLTAIDEAPAGAVCESFVGTIGLDDYLVTRVVELVVHTLDIVAAAGLPDDIPPPPAARIAAEVVAAIGVATAPVPLLRTLTGRAPWPEGASVFG